MTNQTTATTWDGFLTGEHHSDHDCPSCSWVGSSSRRNAFEEDIYYCPRCGEVLEEL